VVSGRILGTRGHSIASHTLLYGRLRTLDCSMAPEVRHFASVSGLLGSTLSLALKINPKNFTAQLNTGKSILSESLNVILLVNGR